MKAKQLERSLRERLRLFGSEELRVHPTGNPQEYALFSNGEKVAVIREDQLPRRFLDGA